jgi:putative spermidine/putrescine transport system permease protein
MTRPRLLLAAPLAGFLLVFFLVPIGWLLSLAVREAEVPRALPRTLAALAGLAGTAAAATGAVAGLCAGPGGRARGPDAGRRGAAAELRSQRRAQHADAGRPREAGGAAPDQRFDAAFFTEIDPTLASADFFAAVQRAQGPVSAYYLLASVDLARNAAGEVERVAEANRIYLEVLARTLGISLSVTVLCLLMGFPVALLLTQVSTRTADWLLVLVLLPFWTSLLVRTAAWVVVLQKEGMVNSLLLKLGLIAEPLALLYNRTGVLVAMTHVLLPFMILPLYTVLKDIPPQYMRAATSLGAPPGLAFRRCTCRWPRRAWRPAR